MAAVSVFLSHLLVLVLNCYLGAASLSKAVKRGPRSAQDADLLQYPTDGFSEGLDQGMVSQHMFKLYEKYNRETRLREGNTVRSFRASQDSADPKLLYRLNLTGLQDTEVILSATFHFLFDRRPRQKAWFCKRFKNPSCRSLPVHTFPSISLLLRATSSGSGVSPGSQLGNITFHPHRRGVWQMKDMTQLIQEARQKGHLLVSVELDFGQHYQRHSEAALSADNLPYLLVYADDQALTEPNSVAASLQRYDPFPEGGETSHSSHSAHSSLGRAKREAAVAPGPIQNNELPGLGHPRHPEHRKDALWETTWHLALKPKSKPGSKEKKRKVLETQGVEQDGGREERRGEPQVARESERTTSVPPHVHETTPKTATDRDSRPPDGADRREGDERRDGGKDGGRKHHERGGGALLSFDERTMRKARRRQWGDSQLRGCSRRNLRVDFADIGWSEWVVAPKAFDAYYCAGTCGFPMPKVVRPSNHATIQSIVRAVGIIPGVPEPCCVPDKMSPLAVLYQDEARNLVLKVYPNMSVQSCSCR